MYNSPWEYRSLLRALFTRLVDDRRSSQISIRRQTITNLILRSVCASISTVSYCIFDLHASGWTLFSQKREFLRPSQQVMVTMSKQVGSIYFIFIFRLTDGIGTVPIDYAHRVCKGLAQLGVHSCYMSFSISTTFFQVHAGLQYYSARGTVVSEMVSPTL